MQSTKDRGKELFLHFISEADKSLSFRIKSWLRENHLVFLIALLSSLSIHVGLFYFFAIPDSTTLNYSSQIQSKDQKSFAQAVQNIQQTFIAELEETPQDSPSGKPAQKEPLNLPGKQEKFHNVLIVKQKPDTKESLTPIPKIPGIPSSLIVSDQKTTNILENLIPIPKIEQYHYFKEMFLNGYDLNSKKIAWQTVYLILNNLNRFIFTLNDISPAFYFIEKINLIEELENLQYNRDSDFLLSLAANNHFERKALHYLFKTYERKINKNNAEYLAIKKISEKLIDEFKRRGYSSLEDVLNGYIREEIEIYNRIIARGGKEKNIALFSLGYLLWEENQYQTALDTWQKTNKDYPINKALQEIRKTLSGQKSEGMNKLILKINSILIDHSYQGNKALMLRLGNNNNIQ